MYADGDPIAELPVTVGVLPGAVQTLVPATTTSPASAA
jgi:diacylglycerol kinase family enzyme